jgi:hypothetical protein
VTHDPNATLEEQARQQRATAERYGYTGLDAVEQLNAEHDRLHAALCGLLGRLSPTLSWVSTGYRKPIHPTRNADAVGWEEDLALDAARWLNTGEYGGALRVLWWLGYDPDEVRAYLRLAVGRPPLEVEVA